MKLPRTKRLSDLSCIASAFTNINTYKHEQWAHKYLFRTEINLAVGTQRIATAAAVT